MIDLESLQLFTRTAAAGTMSAAAKQSNIAVGAVSRRIASLEAYYGVTLLARTGHGVELTPAGRVFFDRSLEILQHVSLARAELSEFGNGLNGSINLMSVPSAFEHYLPEDLHAFAVHRPKLCLDVREAYGFDIVTALREGATDIGIIVSGPNTDGLDVRPYRCDRLAVIAPSNFMPKLQRVRLPDLFDYDFVALPDITTTSKLLASVAGKEGAVLRVRTTVSSFAIMCRMVRSGFGLGIAPQFLAQRLEMATGLRMIELHEVWADRQMLVCTNPFTLTSAAAKELAAHLHDRGLSAQ